MLNATQEPIRSSNLELRTVLHKLHGKSKVENQVVHLSWDKL